MSKSFKVGVSVPSNSTPAFSALRFKTREDADAYAEDLFCRWTAIAKREDMVIEESDEEPNR